MWPCMMKLPELGSTIHQVNYLDACCAALQTPGDTGAPETTTSRLLSPRSRRRSNTGWSPR
jgi:hypothetical protein